MSRFLSKFFCLTMPKKFVGEPFCAMFQKFPEAKKFMDKREWEVSRFSVENFLSHSAAKIRWATFRVSLISGIDKFYASEGNVTVSVDCFCLTEPKKYVGNTSVLCFKKFASAKNFMDKRGEVSRFSAKNFCLTVPKNAVKEPFSHSLILDI